MLGSTQALLETAQHVEYAVGAFNVYNLEGVKAVINAAETANSPVMLQIHPSALKYGKSPLVALCLEAANASTIPVSVHLDHSTSADDIQNALHAGVRSIMVDGSSYPYDENLTFTRDMTQLAHAYGAAVEAEIGRISGTEDGLTITEKEAKMTDPEQAVEFVNATHVDSLAVTIGNVHGKYLQPPRLDFERLERIQQSVSVPLVLHGASGLPESMIQRSIQLGVCKFNVNTEVRQAYMQALQSEIGTLDGTDLLDIAERTISAMQDVVAAKLRLFGSVQKAQLHQTPHPHS
ncbi:MAG: class II fructose-bisphosphate aldolase [Elainellaceae cyanobacterium]